MLFNIYTFSSIKSSPSNIRLAEFTDNLALYPSSPSLKKALDRVTNTTNIINHIENWKIKINTGITEAVLFSMAKKIPNSLKIRKDTDHLAESDISRITKISLD